MSIEGESLLAASTRSADLFQLGRDLEIDLRRFSPERVLDLFQRIRVCDIEGLEEIIGLSREKALRLVRSYREGISGTTDRMVFRTPDARKLKHEILSLFSEEAASRLAKNTLLLLTPSLDKETIQERLSRWATGKELLGELKHHKRLDEVKRILADTFFETVSGKASTWAGSDTLRFAGARRPFMRALKALLSDFEDCQRLGSFCKSVDRRSLEEVIRTLDEVQSAEVVDGEALLSDAEMLINESLRKGRIDEERARNIIEAQLEEVSATLKMELEEENELRNAALERLSIPFEFDATGKKNLIKRWEDRQRAESTAKSAKTEAFLKRCWKLIDDVVERVVLLDQILAVASIIERYSLAIPKIGSDGIGFVGGSNIFLMKEQFEGNLKVQPISYSLGRTRSMNLAKPRNVVMLTGANSGGKTTLLTTLAIIHILTLLGLPVPCEKAEVAPMPIYLYRRRVTRRRGSLEQALSTLIPVFADRHRKLVLMDEFEALTEPGASGRIVAAIMNTVAAGSSLLLIVTHLARETLPHVRLPIRVDGIEATGLDKQGELMVERQPRFNHIGSSTPKLIIMKLSKGARSRNVKALYNDVLGSLEAESMPVQTPLALPWITERTE